MTNIKFYISMAKGYKEMGNINLQIAEEHTHAFLEIEGVNVYEMDYAETEGVYQ